MNYYQAMNYYYSNTLCHALLLPYFSHEACRAAPILGILRIPETYQAYTMARFYPT